jgi:hypothetical protein
MFYALCMFDPQGMNLEDGERCVIVLNHGADYTLRWQRLVDLRSIDLGGMSHATLGDLDVSHVNQD